MKLRKGFTAWRFIALVFVLALVAAACDTDVEPDTTDPDVTETTAPDPDVTDTTAPDPDVTPPAEGVGTYRIAYFSDPLSDNFWAYLDPASSVWTGYVIGPTKPSLYTVQYPGLNVRNDVAVGEVPDDPVQEGDIWVTEATVRDDVFWSDGEPITAEDVVFTFEVVRDFELGGNWLDFWPLANPENPEALGLLDVSADGNTVRFEWTQRPGLAVWGLGNGPWNAQFMARHHWEPHVAASADSSELYAVSGVGDPSGGEVVFEVWEEGAFARNEGNQAFYDLGRQITSGDEQFDLGPYVLDVEFALYGSIDAAVLALAEGEVDYLINPLGIPAGLRPQIVDNPDLQPVINPTNGYRYLAFNLRRQPMGDPAFRQALATRFDRDFVNTGVLQGVALTMYAQVPEGNTAWYDAEFDAELAEQYTFDSDFLRFGAAVGILEEAGYTWASNPHCIDGELQEVDCNDPESGASTIVPGEGIAMPDGTTVQDLEVYGPGPTYDPLRAAWGTWIQQWARDLGIPLTFFPSDFNFVVNQVFPDFVAGETTGDDLDFDMYILGWSLGNPAWPGFHRNFFSSDVLYEAVGGNNNTGFINEEFDALAAQFDVATTFEEGYEIVWEMERILAEELPYILLFDTGILEAHRIDVEFPFDETLGGYPVQQGMQGLVQLAQ